MHLNAPWCVYTIATMGTSLYASCNAIVLLCTVFRSFRISCWPTAVKWEQNSAHRHTGTRSHILEAALAGDRIQDKILTMFLHSFRLYTMVTKLWACLSLPCNHNITNIRKEWPTWAELCPETCRQDRNTWKLTVNCGAIGSGLIIAGCQAVTRGARSCWG